MRMLLPGVEYSLVCVSEGVQGVWLGHEPIHSCSEGLSHGVGVGVGGGGDDALGPARSGWGREGRELGANEAAQRLVS